MQVMGHDQLGHRTAQFSAEMVRAVNNTQLWALSNDEIELLLEETDVDWQGLAGLTRRNAANRDQPTVPCNSLPLYRWVPQALRDQIAN